MVPYDQTTLKPNPPTLPTSPPPSPRRCYDGRRHPPPPRPFRSPPPLRRDPASRAPALRPPSLTATTAFNVVDHRVPVRTTDLPHHRAERGGRGATRKGQGVVGAAYVCARARYGRKPPFPPHSDLSRFPTGLCPRPRANAKDNVPPGTVLRHHHHHHHHLCLWPLCRALVNEGEERKEKEGWWLCQQSFPKSGSGDRNSCCCSKFGKREGREKNIEIHHQFALENKGNLFVVVEEKRS